MTNSTPARGRTVRLRPPGLVWLVASGVLAACSLLAPSDEHYLGGADPANDDGGEGGQSGQSGQVTGGGGHGGDALGGRTNSEGGSAGSDAGGSNTGGSNGGEGGDGPLICDAGFADCNGESSDGCEVDLRSSRDNCGGCGKAYACTVDEVCENGTRFSVSGCSDGLREAFLPVAMWPRIAGCAAWWDLASMRDEKTGVACGWDLGGCNVPADACGAGWHVCASPPYDPSEISSQATQAQCAAQPGAYAAAVGDQHCGPCEEDVDGTGAACCGTNCLQQYGSCVYAGLTAWFGQINEHINLCGAIESYWKDKGVLCCRAP
jgi:hypothetical protein